MNIHSILPSRTILEGPDRAPARSYFYAIGLTEADLQKPIIGIANTWIEAMPCNFHLRDVAAKVKEGVRAAGGTPLEFNTIAIDDVHSRSNSGQSGGGSAADNDSGTTARGSITASQPEPRTKGAGTSNYVDGKNYGDGKNYADVKKKEKDRTPPQRHA